MENRGLVDLEKELTCSVSSPSIHAFYVLGRNKVVRGREARQLRLLRRNFSQPQLS